MIDMIGQRLGEYEIVSQLGEGGMAIVYRAQQQNIKRDVAIKVIQPQLRQDADFNARFNREAQTIASLSHPNIIKVFDYGVLRGFHLKLIDPSADVRKNMVYIVMELLTGGALSNLIRGGALPVTQISQFLTSIAGALDYAHQKGVVHCDLKPENVLLDEGRNIFLADFGIAHLISDTSAKDEDQEFVAGTPYYMAPEQWSGETTGIYTDVYALGVIIYEMLTGKVPFEGDSPFVLMNKHMFAPIPSVRDIRPELPEGVQRVLEQAMAKDPTKRFTSTGQLAASFNAALVAQPIVPSAARIAASSALRQTKLITLPKQPATDYRQMWLSIAALIAVLWVIGGLILFWPRTAQPSQLSSVGTLSVDSLANTLVAATLTQRAAIATNAAALSLYSGTADIQQTVAARVLQIDKSNPR